MFAALNIYKPKGITSHDVVARLRRIYQLKKIGHLGTLDPLAEGVLPVCLGQATRLIEYFADTKRYTASVTLGQTTTTLDSEGDMLSEQDCSQLHLSPETLEAVLSRFRGTIQQEVPLYSAVHVNGKKLYELARQGQTATLPVRETTIHALTLLDIGWQNPAHPVLSLDIHCASGTYIRSLARDIGVALGCGAYMSALIRTEHGRFTRQASIALDTLQQAAQPEQFLLDPTPYLSIPTWTLENETEARRLAQGLQIQPFTIPTVAVLPTADAPTTPPVYWVQYQGQPVGVAAWNDNRLKPLKIFYQPV